MDGQIEPLAFLRLEVHRNNSEGFPKALTRYCFQKMKLTSSVLFAIVILIVQLQYFQFNNSNNKEEAICQKIRQKEFKDFNDYARLR